MEDVALFALEKRLLDPETRRHRNVIEALLDPAFFEIGASGRVWDRQTTIEALVSEPTPCSSASAFQAHWLSADIVLINYTTTAGGQTVLRSSIWRKREGVWKLCFHQATESASYC